MFDDPQEKLKWMERELLEEEAPQEDDLMQRVDALLEEDDPEYLTPKIRRGAAPDENFYQRSYNGEGFDENAAVRPEPKKKGIGGLVLLAILETAAIVAIARWWLQWI